MHTSLTNKKSVIVLFILLTIIIVPYIASCHFIMKHHLASDYAIFYGSAQKIANHNYSNMYTHFDISKFNFVANKSLSSTNFVGHLSSNLNPPIFNLLISPLAQLDYPHSFLLFSIGSMLSTFYSLYLFAKTLYNSSGVPLLLLLLAFLAFLPSYQAFATGQVCFMIMALLLTAWSCGRRGHDTMAGITLGLACCIKYFTGLFFISLLLARRWKIAITMGLTFIALNTIALLTLGLKPHLDYLMALQQIDWFGSNWNASMFGLLTRIAYPTTPITLAATSPLLKFIWAAVFGCGIFLLKQFVDKPSEHKTENWDFTFSLTLVVMLLLSPLGWTYYFTLLILPIALLIRFIIQNHYPLKFTIVFCTLIFMATFPQSYARISMKAFTTLQTFSFYSIYSYSLLLLCGLLCYIRYQPTVSNVTKELDLSYWPLFILFTLTLFPGVNAMFITTNIFGGL